jgi:hypothetical protein
MKASGGLRGILCNLRSITQGMPNLDNCTIIAWYGK